MNGAAFAGRDEAGGIMRFDLLTVLPSFFEGPFAEGVIGRAVKAGVLGLGIHNLRDFTVDRHRTVDDAPYGGGSGMVMKVEPVARALAHIRAAGVAEPQGGGELAGRPTVILLTPQGAPFTQKTAAELAEKDWLVLVSGRYEGVDERVRGLVDMELSIGDYVLTGGEIPALAVIDAVGRLVPGVLGSDDSSGDDSFTGGLLEYPQYTRPEEYEGQRVPEVLLSGDHGRIRAWRRRERLRRTLERRPDLIEKADLTEEDEIILKELEKEQLF